MIETMPVKHTDNGVSGIQGKRERDAGKYTGRGDLI